MDGKRIFEQQMKLLQTVVEQQQAYIQAQNAHMAEKDVRMAEKDETIAELRKLVHELTELKANLEETLHELRRQLFGTASEKTIVKEDDADQTDPMEEKSPVTVKEHTRERRSKSKRDDLYANLPIREAKIPLAEEQRRCEYCNSEMVTMTYTPVREEIRITPAKVERIRLMQEVAICPECRKDGDGTVVKAGVCLTTDRNPVWQSWDLNCQERLWLTGSFTAQSITSIQSRIECMMRLAAKHFYFTRRLLGQMRVQSCTA